MESGRDCFLRYLLRGTAVSDPQTCLDENDDLRRSLGMAYFLADSHDKQDVLTFVSDTLPLLLRQLQRTTRRERIAFQGQIRGRVDWPATTKARLQNEVNPALYVCRPPLRQDNTPENQLLKFLLEAIDRLIRDLSLDMQNAELWTAVSDTHFPFSQRLAQITFHVRQALGHARLRPVETPEMVTARHLVKARASKTELYGLVAQLYDQYKVVVVDGRWLDLLPIFGRTILLPDPAVPLGDTCIQLAARGFVQARQA
ncbi:MAG: hypothetical protein KC415_15825 [Anaerolineales bacterium]|nr:hypothetical protein [Anaerolineales bacterium]MCB8990065.1 hypothetical protein [Ardenticatenaceae bacterium]MCB9005624.1 hypothetical protein [Ardenticatenaceae bacterium]